MFFCDWPYKKESNGAHRTGGHFRFTAVQHLALLCRLDKVRRVIPLSLGDKGFNDSIIHRDIVLYASVLSLTDF